MVINIKINKILKGCFLHLVESYKIAMAIANNNNINFNLLIMMTLFPIPAGIVKFICFFAIPTNKSKTTSKPFLYFFLGILLH